MLSFIFIILIGALGVVIGHRLGYDQGRDDTERQLERIIRKLVQFAGRE